jgi:hypothetical protein
MAFQLRCIGEAMSTGQAGRELFQSLGNFVNAAYRQIAPEFDSLLFRALA